MDLVAHVGPDAWLELLLARESSAPWPLVLGKGVRPPLPIDPSRESTRERSAVKGRLYLVACDRLRARAPVVALTCGIVDGWRLELDLAGLEGVTLEHPVPWALRLRERSWPLADELPFAGWTHEGLPAELGPSAAAIASTWRPPPVVRAPPPKKPVGAGQASLFF